MLSFHGDVKIKEKYLARVKAHQEADEIIKGKYWENGKGCAVGCTIEGSDHSKYEKELGVYEWLAHVEDDIFEGLEISLSKEFPYKFLESIPVGVDVNLIKIPFLIFIVESVIDKFDHEKFPDVKNSIDNVLSILKEIKNHEIPENLKKEILDAAKSAGAAAWAAGLAAGWAAEAAAWAAAWAALGAVGAVGAAEAAEGAEGARGAGAVRAAAKAAKAAGAAAGAVRAAEEKAYSIFADKLIEFLKGLENSNGMA